MTIQTKAIALAVAGALTTSAAFAQTRRAPAARVTPTTTATEGAQELGAGWTALAAGRAGDAETAAARLLQRGTKRHDAAALLVEARVQAGRVDAALDGYEQWLQGRTVEDVFLLQPIARGRLQAEAQSRDIAAKVQALRALAQAGDRDAAGTLEELATAAGGAGGAADEALAELGNPGAVRRLSRQIETPGTRDVSTQIDALAKGHAKEAVTSIAAALEPSRPAPTRMSAARALGLLDAQAAVPKLKQALQDPDPPVRMTAAAALARLGDQSGAALLQQMQDSPVADIRLMAVEAEAPANPSGSWVAVARSALQDPDPMARLGAAGLLAQYAADPRPALTVLTQAFADPNPAMRFAAARAMADVPAAALGDDIPTLRRLLRDPAPLVRIAAAGGLLRVAGGAE